MYYGGTFFVFSDYVRPAIRLSALMGVPVTYVFTHDSVAVGEDGPTHEPVEHLAALRAMPGLSVIRPADANETAAAWNMAVSSEKYTDSTCICRVKTCLFFQNQLNLRWKALQKVHTLYLQQQKKKQMRFFLLQVLK